MSVLYQRTRELLRTRPATKTYAQIASETGLAFEFIRRTARDKNARPDVKSVEKLYEYLAGKRLEIK